MIDTHPYKFYKSTAKFVKHCMANIYRASKHIYLLNMTGYQKSRWLNNAGSPFIEERQYRAKQ